MKRVKFDTDIKNQADNEKSHISCRALSTKHIGKDRLKELSKRAINYPIAYRHVGAQSYAQGEVLGIITDSNIKTIEEEGEMRDVQFLEADLFNDTEYQRDAIEYIKLRQESGKPIQMSAAFIQYSNETVPLEYSITHKPVYKHSEVIMMEEKEELEEKINKLRSKLDKKVDENKVLSTKLSEVKTQLEEANTKVESTEKKLEGTVEERINIALEEVSQKLDSKYKERVTKLEEELKFAKKEPIIKDIYKLEKDDELRDNYYPKLSVEKLESRLEKVEKRANSKTPRVVTETVSQSDSSVEKLEEDKEKWLERFSQHAKKIAMKGDDK